MKRIYQSSRLSLARLRFCPAANRRRRGLISAKFPVKMNSAAEQNHLELSQLHDPFPILTSLCGASIGADETVAFVRELLEMALVPREAPYPEKDL